MDHKREENLVFFKEKIKEIKIALFKSEIDSELQLPNNIVETLKVEDDGTIWFFTTCNGNHARFIDKSFFAYLNYYKKGTDCHFQLCGKAIIVDNDYESPLCILNSFTKGKYASVLVKMKIMQADFFENKTFTNVSWTEKIKSAINNLFLSTHRVYNFS